MGNSKCRGCGAEITFVRTTAGRLMPCDPPLVPYWARAGAPGKVVTIGGRVVSCDFEGARDKVTGCGRVSHFATCPAARRFKRE